MSARVQLAYPGERLYGLGQHTHGLLDQKGAVVDLVQRNGEVTIPLLVSSRGYGLLWSVLFTTPLALFGPAAVTLLTAGQKIAF